MPWRVIVCAEPNARRQAIEQQLNLHAGSVSRVDAAMQVRVQRTFSRFWQERLVSLVETETPLVRDLLLRPHFYLQSGLRVEHEALPATDPLRLPRARQLCDIGESLLERKLTSLSNGELRRVLVARAYMENPRVLLLDDPFGGLDPEHRTSLLKALQACGEEEGMEVLCFVPEEESTPTGLPILPSAWPMGGQELLWLDRVSVGFGEYPVLSQVSWQIHQGEHFLLTGPNGSGKSTLLSLLTADHPQLYRNAGRIRLLGREPGQGLNVWEHKRKLGFCSPELHHQWDGGGTLLDTVSSGFLDPRDPHGSVLQEERRQAHAALCALELDPSLAFAQVDYTTQRLVLVARALVRHPVLVILDEPDQGLNTQGRQKLCNFLDYHMAHGRSTLVLASHHHEHLPSCIRAHKVLVHASP